MEFIQNCEEWRAGKSAITTGNFDGVHRGHRFLLGQLVERAHMLGVSAVVVMFYPHPRQVLNSNVEPYRYLTERDEQLQLMADCGVDYVVQVSFNKTMASWSAEDFIQRILINKLNMIYFLVGYDHRLGNPHFKNDIGVLSQKLGFELCRSEPYYQDGVLVSSTVVRELLSAGAVDRARFLLGRDYGFNCRVVGGKKVGRTIGYPTANLVPDFSDVFLPKEGVYAVRVKLGEALYGGMMQVGHRPTLEDGRGLTLEVHIFDFDEDIYNKSLRLYFHKYLRDIKKFSGIEGLLEQLKIDEKEARISLFSE